MSKRYSRHLLALVTASCLSISVTMTYAQVADPRQQRTISVTGIHREAVRTGYAVFSEIAKQSQAHPAPNARRIKPWMPIPTWFQKAGGAGGNQKATPGSKGSSNLNSPLGGGAAPLGGGGPPPAFLASFLGCPDVYRSIPPDTMGAVGPTRIVSTTNDMIRIQDRLGNVLSEVVPIDDFWVAGGLTPPPPNTEFLSDPKVIYDTTANRFVLTEASFDAPNESLFIAVSITNDPTGGWRFYRVKADPGSALLADYPSVGFNSKWYVISQNMYSNSVGNFQKVRIYMFDKADLYNPAGTAKHTILDDPGGGFNMAPAPIYDSTANMFFVDDWDPTSAAMRFSTVTGAVGSEVLNAGVSFPILSKTWDFADEAPQKGASGTIPTGDIWRPMTLAYRNGQIWVVHNVGALDGVVPFRSVAQFFELDTSGNLLQDGRVDDPGSATPSFYYYPSIAVNTSGTVCIGMTRSSVNEYASSYFANRFSVDSPGSIRQATLIKAGTGPYDFGGGFGAFRWGDFSATMVDPDQSTFWTIQQIAVTPNPTFATWWGHLSLVLPPLSVTLNPASVTAGDPSTGSVYVQVAPLTNKVVNLSSDNTGVATVDQPSIIIPAGQHSGTFTISTNPNIAGLQIANIAANDGTNFASAQLTVTAFLAGLEFEDPFGNWVPALDVKGGSIVHARVRLSDPAPNGGIVVQLASEDPNSATVTPSVTIQTGRTIQDFYVFTVPVLATTTALITASARASKISGALIVDAPVPYALSIIPATVVGGNKASGVVYIDSPAPSVGLSIALTSSKPQYASVPPFVIVPPSKTYVTFPITTFTVTANQTALISASNEGVTVNATINVAPVVGASLASLVFNPSTVPGGQTLKGTITLTRPAPTGGITVGLSKADPIGAVKLPVPPSVFIPAGIQVITFYLQTNVVSVDANATIIATYGTGSKSAAVKVRAPYLISVTILPTSIRVNTTGTGRVFLSGPANLPVTVTLTYSTGVTGPASVIVPQGQTVATFTVTAKATGTQTVTGTYPVGTSVTAPLLVFP